MFRSIYGQLKGSFSSASSFENLGEYDSFSVFTPILAPPALLSDTLETSGLDPIFRMAREPFLESQLEAVRTLCDLSAEESLQQPLCELGVVEVLRDLMVSSASAWAQQHAALALANLSECKICQEVIISSGILPVLLSLSTNGPYQSTELRRLATFIFANVASSSAAGVISCLGQDRVTAWMGSVDTLMDERLKLHAERAREFLAESVQVM